jgi:hypothetical protein
MRLNTAKKLLANFCAEQKYKNGTCKHAGASEFDVLSSVQNVKHIPTEIDSPNDHHILRPKKRMSLQATFAESSSSTEVSTGT